MPLKRVPENITYKCPDTLMADSSNSFVEVELDEEGKKNECPICMVELEEDVVKLQICDHHYHRECIEQAVAASPKCPVCRLPVGEPRGKCPSGTMYINGYSRCCAGYEQYGTIQISYNLQGGTQKSFHQNPGVRYHRTNRTAFLPDNEEGRNLLKRLKYAWRRGLSFTIGTSLTTGAHNVIVWSSIHHKTSISGGVHGFPDPGYFANCNEELDNLSVPKADCLDDNGTLSNKKRPREGESVSSDDDDEAEAEAETNLADMSPIASFSPWFPGFSQTISSAQPFVTTRATASRLLLGAFPSASLIQAAALPMAISITQPESILYMAPAMLPHSTPNTLHGTSPSGTMRIQAITSVCSGYETTSCGSIQITYTFPAGIQEGYHQSPGVLYSGAFRDAFLPNNQEGTDLLKRLKCAWKRGLCFSIGTSQTTGQQNAIIWTSIPHKTSLNGGPQMFGYPDPGYIVACNNALDRFLVPTADKLLGDSPSPVPSAPPSPILTTLPASVPTPELAGSPNTGAVFPQIITYTAPDSGLGVGQGIGPSGTMKIERIHKFCSGYEQTTPGSIMITYSMRNGKQRAYHPNPGTRYNGATRSAYLPDNAEGLDLLKRLKHAWKNGLCFSVGSSQSSGKSNTVVWSTIPHKSNLRGGTFGYPDRTYFANCHGELDRLGVPAAANCAV